MAKRPKSFDSIDIVVTKQLGPAFSEGARLLLGAEVPQCQIASKLKRSPSVVSRWLNGTCRPDIESMVLLEEKFGIPIKSWLKRPSL